MANILPPPGDIPATADTPRDTFKTEYHPKSGRVTIIDPFSTFSRSRSAPPPVVDDEPWHPFTSRADFEFAEIAHKSALSKEQTDNLLHLIWRILARNTGFTLKSHTDVSDAWTRASMQLTPFEKHIVPVRHKKEDLKFEVHIRPLWDWAMDLLQDPFLAPHFVWDAEHLYKHNGTRFERFVDEPWTADRWWQIQSALPDNGVPFAFILHADKTNLSSSGKVKGYPVVARCGNLPVGLRNGDGIGGGRMVGWLPIVSEDSGQDGKLTFTNLKHVVWHQSFLKLLDSIILLSKTGFAHKCFDDVLRWLYPIILILSADYEEQCVMAAIRGFNSYTPCPVCLVPANELYDHTTTHALRTCDEARARHELYRKSRKAGDAYMKAHSLRPVDNAFWRINHSDPHQFFCFDPLHVDDIRMWGDHLFEELKKCLERLGRAAKKAVDDQHDAFPRWHNFNHFKSVTNISYSDGNKLLDISKQILYTTQNIITQEADAIGYALLKCIASYIQYHMYISLDVHTESTLEAGEKELLVFHQCLQSYISMQDPASRKNWNFPKVHSAKHAFNDIREKGAACNFSTRPNEKVHGPFKHAFFLQTNWKDVANQLLRLDHTSIIAELIRGRIDHLDTEHLKWLLDERALEDGETDTMDYRTFNTHIYLGSPQRPIMFAAIEAENLTSHAFHDFRKKFTMFINEFVLVHDIPMPDGQVWLKPTAEETVQEFRYLKVNYESTFFFVCLLFLFRYTVDKRTLDLALVLPLDALASNKRTVDKDLHFTRLRLRSAAAPEFIPLESIVHGALLVPDLGRDGDYFLVDNIDGDMFLCAKQLQL
ncbi:hypothetical protein BDN67DRAFT_992580 [Paxillus ammoniavirescens]|nr:hypothetical protein BDN67DRAFT_992580 [Paxillus ammoniavirescens]